MDEHLLEALMGLRHTLDLQALELDRQTQVIHALEHERRVLLYCLAVVVSLEVVGGALWVMQLFLGP